MDGRILLYGVKNRHEIGRKNDSVDRFRAGRASGRETEAENRSARQKKEINSGAKTPDILSLHGLSHEIRGCACETKLIKDRGN